MRKFFLFFSMSLLLLTIASINVKASGSDAYYIVTNPGEDMSTMMNVNWHASETDYFVEFTEASNSDYSTSTKVIGECNSFAFNSTIVEGTKTITTNGFTPRFSCSANLENLQPNTKYKYHVGKTTFSSDYYFQTGSEAAPFSFLFLADPQYANSTGASVFNGLITKAKEVDNDIRFSLFTGDVVDRGGIMSQWDILFNQSNVKNMPFAVVPGNHEYYDASATPVTYNSLFFNGFYNNPKNGALNVNNSSYYFKYNNALFIGIDSEAAALNTSLLNAQKDWFKNVIESNFAQYIIVYMHRSFYGSQYASVSPGLRAAWQPLFDKYGVDLVLTGHDHVYSRTKSIYNGVETTDEHQGTVYLIGGSSGQKFYSVVPNPLFDKTFQQQSSASIFRIDNLGIHLKTIGTSGNVLDEVTIAPKRASSPTSTFDKNTYLNYVSLDCNSNDRTKATLYFGSKGYGYVNSIKLIDEEDQEIGFDYINTNYITEYNIENLVPNQFYNYTLKVNLKDGSTLEKPITLSTKLPYGTINNLRVDDSIEDNIQLMWYASLENNQIWKYNIYLNGELFKEANADVVSIAMNDLNKYHLNTIKLEAIDVYRDVVYSEEIIYGEEAEAVVIAYPNNNLQLNVGDENTPQLTINPNQNLDLRYSSSNENVATIDANGKIKAIGVGEAIITVRVAYRNDVYTTLTVNVSEKEVPPTEEKEKKGCFSKSLDPAVLSMISLFGFLMFVRRKKY